MTPRPIDREKNICPAAFLSTRPKPISGLLNTEKSGLNMNL